MNPFDDDDEISPPQQKQQQQHRAPQQEQLRTPRQQQQQHQYANHQLPSLDTKPAADSPVVIKKQGSRYEPVPRFGHNTVVVKDKLFLWGGWQKGFPKVHTSEEKTSLCLKMDVLALKKGEWSQVETYGDPPLGVRGYSMAAIDYNLYYFGGYCGHDFCRHNTIKCLDTMTMKWSDISCSNPNKSPMKKNACGMVAFKDNGEDYLFIYGGAGMLCTANDPDSIYIPWKENPDFGWTNEAHVLHLSTGTWSTPSIRGDKPPPSAGFTLTQTSPNTAIFMGGLNPFIQECIPDVYKVELNHDYIQWSKLNIATPPDARPRPRHDHCAACISDVTTDPCILMAGGRDVRWKSLEDVWVLNCETGCWNQLNVPEDAAHRHFHSLSVLNISSSCGYAVMFGGLKEWEKEAATDDQPMISNTTILELGCSSEGVWSVTALLDSPMLSSTEEYKCRIIQRLFETLNSSIPITDQIHQQPARTKGPDPVYEQTISDLQQQILSKDVQISNLEARIEELTRQLENAHSEMSALHKKKNDTIVDQPIQATAPPQAPSVAPAQQYPPQLQLSSAISPQSSSITAELIAIECTEDALKPYELSAKDVGILSGTPIHKGAYGHTNVANYRGTQVAACVLNIPPSSAFERMVFNREALKATRSVHPNIAMFFGIMVDSTCTAIMSELMVSNLRYELEKKAFAKQDVLNIASDLARGLLYLHTMKPRPIIHRAVASPNIFLEPLAFKWRAKLSDTILSNYYHYTSNGSPLIDSVYCPPELEDPERQTTKFDIYSFGVVVLEVVARKPPNESEAERRKLLKSLKWTPVVELVTDCLAVDQSIRPAPDQILVTLEKLHAN